MIRVLLRRVLAALRRNRTPSAYWGPACDMCQGSLDGGWHLMTGGPLGGQYRLALCAPCAGEFTQAGFTVDPMRRLP